VFDKVNYLEV